MPEQNPSNVPMTAADALMRAELDRAARNAADSRRARWAYLFSVLFFPFGLVLALYYAFSGKPYGRRLAVGCTLATVITGAVLLLMMMLALQSLDPAMLEQLKAVNVEDYKALLE